jgi:hypothetical protein
MGDAVGEPDLAGLSAGLTSMRPNEFDAWLSGSDSGAYRPVNASELAERNELAAFRELDSLHRERRRLTILRGVDPTDSGDWEGATAPDWNSVRLRLAAIESQIVETRTYLESAGWTPEAWADQ